jgi:hypothetical protein
MITALCIDIYRLLRNDGHLEDVLVGERVVIFPKVRKCVYRIMPIALMTAFTDRPGVFNREERLKNKYV